MECNSLWSCCIAIIVQEVILVKKVITVTEVKTAQELKTVHEVKTVKKSDYSQEVKIVKEECSIASHDAKNLQQRFCLGSRLKGGWMV